MDPPEALELGSHSEIVAGQERWDWLGWEKNGFLPCFSVFCSIAHFSLTQLTAAAGLLNSLIHRLPGKSEEMGQNWGSSVGISALTRIRSLQ